MRTEGRVEEAAGRECPACGTAPNVECFAGTLPRSAKSTFVQRRNLIRKRRNEVLDVVVPRGATEREILDRGLYLACYGSCDTEQAPKYECNRRGERQYFLREEVDGHNPSSTLLNLEYAP